LNYLAHLYLSGPDPEIMTGNFIGDHVKGKNYKGFSAGMIKGVELHRAIDTFTDNHFIVSKSKQRLRPAFHKYAPVIVDVFYDHLLASQWSSYSQQSLDDYTQTAYLEILKRHALLPARAQYMLKYMVPQNWLLNYAQLNGIHKALSGMASRTTFDSGMEKATQWLEKDHDLYKKEFEMFFPELMQHAREFLLKG
jgi:acyl carrier protein phosphodiesterase